MQERVYDTLLNQAVSHEEIEAVRLHQLADYMNALARIPLCMWILNREKRDDKDVAASRTIFAEWAISDEDFIAACRPSDPSFV
jgi:hypothetical protein